MTPTVPLTVYFEGTLNVGDTLYTYLSSVALNITSYRILSRDGVSTELQLRKNGVLLDVLEVTSLDTGVVTIPNLYFATGDTFSIQVSAVGAGSLEGLTMIFNCTVADSVANDPVTNSKRIQTPFVSRFEGVLVQGNTFFAFLPTQRIEVFRFTATLRVAADRDVLFYLQQAGTTVATLTIGSGQTVATGLLSCFFNTGEQLTVYIQQVGSVALGESLCLFLDYRNTDQTTFADFQTPFIVEYEGDLIVASNLLLSYTLPRQVTIAAAQLFARDPVTAVVQVGLYKNSQIQTTFSILTGQNTTAPFPLNISFVTGDLLEVRVLVGNGLTSGLLLTLDYFIVSGDNAIAYTYYSDPQTDIVLLARQVGIGGAKADAISFENLLKYQQDVDAQLNGRLRALYRVPLAKVSSGYNPWPSQIQLAAQRLVLKYLFGDVYSEVDPNTSAAVQRQGELANEELNRLLNREFILEGQRLRSRNYGSNPSSEPLGTGQPLPTPLLR